MQKRDGWLHAEENAIQQTIHREVLDMDNKPISIGDLVRAEYKTGVYAGEVVDLAPGRATVKVLAVLKHPTQGDLHNPFQGDVPFFHQRRALAYQEKALVPLAQITAYAGEVGDYRESLMHALAQEIAQVKQQTSTWAARALQELEQLQNEYFPQNK